jgi:5-(carboxyamino)imidazole ribonucleotide synthase
MQQGKLPVIGIIGGGQLGRMFIEEALRYNVQCVILDNDSNAPAALIAHKHIRGSINNREAIHQLAASCDILTYEIEHIFVEALDEIERSGKKVFPTAQVLRTIQDKGLQKQFYLAHGIATPDFVIVSHPKEWAEVVSNKGWSRFVAKSCRDGYDGKGVHLMHASELSDISRIPFSSETVLEAFVECAKEISVIVACDISGNAICYPAVEMEFDPHANLVTYLFAPANLNDSQEAAANQLALQTAKAFNSPGLFAVEMFLDKEGNFWVNETAPRPHNSGHHTIEACYTSQYEQLLRILLGMPLGSAALIKHAAMINILGDTNFTGPYYLDNEAEILQTEGVYIHLYGKNISKPKRKLGHITILADDALSLKEKVNRIKPLIQIKPVL